MANEVTINDIRALEGKVNALIEMLSNKTGSNIKALDIKEFIDKYSIVKDILHSNTIESFLETINSLNKEIQEIQEKANIPLAVANRESQKIIDAYSDNTTQLALNIADVKLFKNNVYMSFKKMYDYINDINIDKKMFELNTQIAFAKNLSKQIIAQKEKIQEVITKNEQQDQFLEKIENVNKEQDKQIDYVNDLIVMMEKQIENYSFFAEEFNTIYMTAKDFLKEFAFLEKKIDYIVRRDDALEEVVKSIVGFVGEDYKNLHQVIDVQKNKMDKFMGDIISWTNDSLMFNNEVKAYNLSLSAYNSRMKDINDENIELGNLLNNIKV